jgi:hypothetical protein
MMIDWQKMVHGFGERTEWAVNLFDEQALNFSFSHGTGHGRIYIKPRMTSGGVMWDVFLDDRTITSSTFIDHAVKDISEGKLNREFGFDVSKLRLPLDVWLWRVTGK